MASVDEVRPDASDLPNHQDELKAIIKVFLRKYVQQKLAFIFPTLSSYINQW